MMEDEVNWKNFFRFVGIAALVIVVLAIAAFALGWITLPLQKGSAGNVEAQFTYGYQTIEALKSTARSVCQAQKTYDQETDPNIKSQRATQLLAFQNNYSRLQGEYDAWAENAFQGRVVRPGDLPIKAPSLEHTIEQECGG